MGRTAKRVPFSEFKAPSRSLIQELDWQRGAEILSDTDKFTEMQISALVDIWHRYAVFKAQSLNEPYLNEFTEKLKSAGTNVNDLLKLYNSPTFSSEGRVAFAIDDELKSYGIDTSAEEFLSIMVIAINKLGSGSALKGVPYVEPFTTLIIEHRDICKHHGYIFNGFTGNGIPTKFAEFIFEMHGQLPKELQLKKLRTSDATAVRIKRAITKNK